MNRKSRPTGTNYKIIAADTLRDKEPILQFWNSHNEKKLDEKYAWIYESNPDGIAETWLLKNDESPDILGIATLFPRYFQNNNVLYKSGILGDFFIHPKHRTLGPAVMLLNAIISSMNELGLSFIYGFPNERAEPVLKRVGFKALGDCVRYVKLFDIERLLIEKLSIPPSIARILAPIGNQLLKTHDWSACFRKRRKIKILHTSAPNPDVESLLTKHHDIYFSARKSYDYLKWKYASDPDDKNYFFHLYDGNENISGCIVYRFDYTTVDIREVLYGYEQSKLIDLLTQFFKYIGNKNIEYAYIEGYEECGLFTRMRDLKLQTSKTKRSIYILINPNHNDSETLAALLASDRINLLITDQDT